MDPLRTGFMFGPLGPATAFMGNSTCGLTGTPNRLCRTAFLNNSIPTGRMYAPALALMQYFPEPNLSGLENNFNTDQNLIRPYKSFLARIDQNINANNSIFGKFYHSRNTEEQGVFYDLDKSLRGTAAGKIAGGEIFDKPCTLR